MFTAIDKDSQKAAALAAKSLSTNFVSIEDGMKRSLVGNPAELAKKLELYSKAGVEITELKFVYSEIPDLVSMLKLFAEEVLPSFSD
jgi:hypothetical protein